MAEHDFQHVLECVRCRQNAACRAQPLDRARLLSSVNGQSQAEIPRFFDTPVSPAPDAWPISAQLSRADPGEHGGGEEQWASIQSLPATSWMMPLRRRRFVR